MKAERGVIQFRAAGSGPQRRAGPYLLTKELGRGDVGTVYLGERVDGQYKGEVAVRLLRPGSDTDSFIERFEHERQAVARLQHPNIAHLLDSGRTEDGTPYIVMERVDGTPINEYCREKNPSVDQILRLFLPVCHAVSHAHQHFIVHRDLKPSNILVESTGTPMLLDFGICKVAEDGSSQDRTESGQPASHYASPEHMRGDPITVASDVYSLGAVLHELLRGKTHTPLVKMDLDAVLRKALQNIPERRYASVEQFGEDLRRILDHEPLLARPHTISYRARKFVRRHRPGIAATLLLLISLSVALIGYAWTIAFDIREAVDEMHAALGSLDSAVVTRTTRRAQFSDDRKVVLALARSYAAMGSVQHLLRNETEARRWRQRALDEYRKLTGKPEFTKANQEQMAELEALLK